jgi:CheY-like chemotaxis protein
MTFLIVDDHRINLMLLKNFLDPYEIVVYEAYDGVEALKIWNSKSIDVLITDHYMPLMDGLELIKHIKKENRNKTICALVTGERNIQSDICDYLFIKPIIKKQFDHFIKEINNK